MPQAPGIARQLWHKWKALRLPWRRQFLRGADLGGNTFWEFRDNLNANRWRRIVKYGYQPHYADVQISPQWHQWLRHTRDEAPTLAEQQFEVSRQARMKQLAAQADERWKSIPSYLDKPEQSQPAPAIGVKDPGGYVEQTGEDEQEGVRSAVGVDEAEVQARAEKEAQQARKRGNEKLKKEENPWAPSQKGGPSEGWQPESWSPGVAQRR